MIDFSAIKIAFDKITIDKSRRHKEATGKITIYKSAVFKFSITDFIFVINDSFKFSIQNIISHTLNYCILDFNSWASIEL